MTVNNYDGKEIPGVGGPGKRMFLLAGLFLSVLSGAGLLLRRRA